MRRFSLLFILVFFVTATHFFVPVPVKCDKPPATQSGCTSIQGTRTASGSLVKIFQNGDMYVCLQNPKEGMLIARIGSTAEVLYHNYTQEGRRLELTLATIQQALDQNPDCVFISVRDGVVEGMILATTKTETETR